MVCKKNAKNNIKKNNKNLTQNGNSNKCKVRKKPIIYLSPPVLANLFLQIQYILTYLYKYIVKNLYNLHCMFYKYNEDGVSSPSTKTKTKVYIHLIF